MVSINLENNLYLKPQILVSDLVLALTQCLRIIILLKNQYLDTFS